MFNSGHIVVTPAYGRDYRSKRTLMTDWKAGKDFIMQPSGMAIGINDDLSDISSIEFRYSGLRKVHVEYIRKVH